MKIAFFLIFLFPNWAFAEYRAYELLVTDTASNQSRIVLSTLDHLQYPTYHHLKPTEKVEMKSTWKCLERSDYFQPICPNPQPAPDGAPRLPASSAATAG